MTSLGCARCGDCCEMTFLNVSLGLMRSWLADPGDMDPESDHMKNARFLTEHWHPHSTEPDAYVCDRFDLESRLCTAHEDRPPVCSQYPWYGGEPSGGKINKNLNCSYLLDLPPDKRPKGARPLIPIEVV